MRFGNEEIELNDKGRACADRRDPDGSLTSLREAREHYEAGNRKQGDAMVVLIVLRGHELGDADMTRAARELAASELSQTARGR